MSNINNKSIILSLGILAIFAIGVIFPNTAKAFDEGMARPYNAPNPNTAYLYQYPPNNYNPQAPGYYYNPALAYQPQVAPYNNTQVVYVPGPTKTVYKTVSTNNTSTTTANTSDSSSTDQNSNSDYTDKYSALGASALFGGGSFAPSGLTQWIMLAILILIIIIIGRRIFGASDRYHKTPLKHA
jgi:hypothetical protein